MASQNKRIVRFAEGIEAGNNAVNIARESNISRRRPTAFETPFSRIEDGELIPEGLVESIDYSAYGMPLKENDQVYN